LRDAPLFSSFIENFEHEPGNATRAAAPAGQSPDHRFGDLVIRGVLGIK